MQLGVTDEALVWTKKYEKALKEAYSKDIHAPHMTQVGVGWRDIGVISGEYWSNPFYKG
jgi:hypothetical protein